MLPLFQRFPRLRAVPHTPLIALPTPVAPLPALGEAIGAGVPYLKRSDHGGGPFGGAKLRLLEFHLGEAVRAGATAVLTAGTAGSNHVLSTALAARRIGLPVTALLVPQPPSAIVRRNVLLSHQAGARLVALNPGTSVRDDALAVREHLHRLRAQGHRVHFVPFGGAGGSGVLGAVNAGLELADQIAAGALPEPRRIYLAAASGGTAAGALLGLRAAGVRSRVLAVRVVGRAFLDSPGLLALARAMCNRIRALDSSFPAIAPGHADLLVRHEYAGRGYGLTSPAGLRAARLLRELHGVELDGCYTAKAFAAMLGDMRRKRPDAGVSLFWHTGIATDLSPALAHVDATSLPPALRHYLTADPEA
jgi:1-aminocyclopropane-1-carboxylate deaminase/D-cysteine desulfhydrase-like pyridoxal-dependent ACC family enzyme